MTDFNVRSDSVDVEQIMARIRERVREKRGVDYTEDEIRELASVKLERFLDPRSLRSDLIEHYRKARPQDTFNLPPPPETFVFEEDTIYTSTRPILRAVRRLLNPLLKLFFSPNPIIHALNQQSRINEYLFKIDSRVRGRHELDLLNYELLHNLVVETTRASIEVKNMKMHVEALAARLDFVERRARALEGVVQYRTEALPVRPIAPLGEAKPAEAGADKPARKRRRRRGRRRPAEGEGEGGGEGAAPEGALATSADAASSGAGTESAGDSDRVDRPSAPAAAPPAASEDSEPTES